MEPIDGCPIPIVRDVAWKINTMPFLGKSFISIKDHYLRINKNNNNKHLVTRKTKVKNFNIGIALIKNDIML